MCSHASVAFRFWNFLGNGSSRNHNRICMHTNRISKFACVCNLHVHAYMGICFVCMQIFSNYCMSTKVCPHSEPSCSGPGDYPICLRCSIQSLTRSAENFVTCMKERQQERTVLVNQVAALMRSESYDGSPKMLRLQKRIYVTYTREKAGRRLRDYCRDRLAKAMLELAHATKDENKTDV